MKNVMNGVVEVVNSYEDGELSVGTKSFFSKVKEILSWTPEIDILGDSSALFLVNSTLLKFKGFGTVPSKSSFIHFEQ